MALAPWLRVEGIGHIGVYLFFVLSGYLLTRNLLDGQGTAAFYARRVFRIAPLYFVVLASVVVWQAYGHYNRSYLHIDGGAEGALLHFLFLQGDGIFWTIPVEFFFYLVLPPLTVAVARYGRRWILLTAALYFGWFFAIKILRLPLPPLRVVDITLPSQFFDVFLCGMYAAHVRAAPPPRFAAAAFWGLLLLTLFCISVNFLGSNRPWNSLRWMSLLYGAVFAMTIISATHGNRLITAVVDNAALRFMGVVGFSWYLLHLAVIAVVNTITLPSPVKLGLAFLGCAVLCWITHQMIERPGMRLGRMLERRLSAAAA